MIWDGGVKCENFVPKKEIVGFKGLVTDPDQ
jgi:hypothetical protein